MTIVLAEVHALLQSKTLVRRAYLDLCPEVVQVEGGWKSYLSADYFDGYIESYTPVVLLTEMLNQFAVCCVRKATLGSTRSTYYVPVLITGLIYLNPSDIIELVGEVSISSTGGRVDVFATLNSGARNYLLATITVMSLVVKHS